MSGSFRGTVFVLSSVHWHFTWQRHQELASRFAAAGFDVIYSEPLPKRWPGPSEAGRVLGRLLGRSEMAGTCLQEVPDGVRVVAPRALPDTARPWRALNGRWLAPRIAARWRALEPPRPWILWNFLPLAVTLELGAALDPDLTIYDCVWDWPNDPLARPGVFRETEVVAASDIVLADAPYLVERMKGLHVDVHQVLPAVDWERFEPARRPQPPSPRLGPDGRARCGYFGALGFNLDLELLRAVSRAATLRLIGPIQTDLGILGPDTEIVGPVARERLPELLADLDVLVLPYREGGHARAVIPAKTFECLATGKRTLVKGLPSLAAYSDVFDLCASGEQLLDRLAHLGQDGEEARARRLEVARANSWEARTEEILAIVQRGLERRGRERPA